MEKPDAQPSSAARRRSRVRRRGLLLFGVLVGATVAMSEGTYIYDVPVTSVDQQRLLSVSELVSDQRVLEIASAGSVPVSLDHLRGRDADQTLVRVGYMID